MLPGGVGGESGDSGVCMLSSGANFYSERLLQVQDHQGRSRGSRGNNIKGNPPQDKWD